MKKCLLVLIILAIASGLNAQANISIIRVKENYAVINKGTSHGVQAGDRFKMATPDNPAQYGEVEVIRPMKSISAIKLITGHAGYSLKVGDQEQETEEAIVDGLLNEPPDYQQRQRPTTQSQGYVTGQMGNSQVKRKGFIIGIGLGFGSVTNETKIGTQSASESKGTFLTNFKIGYAPSNLVEIYYVSKVSWWGESSITYILGVSGVGVTTYFNRNTASGFFLSAGLGLSVLDAPFEQSLSSSDGFGLTLGGGYEFSRHWNFELDLLYSSISEFGVELNSFGLRLTINVLHY